MVQPRFSVSMLAGYDYNDLEFFYDDGYAVVETNGKYGIIDDSGKIIVTPQFDRIISITW